MSDAMAASTYKMQLDGYEWWRVTPLEEYMGRYGHLVFNPLIYGFSIAMWSIAMWMTFDLLLQIHITFKRFGGLYYWTVMATTIGVGLHATMLTAKAFSTLTLAQELGTTVLVKIADVLTQTGFSLVLYSRLNLVMRTHNQKYLKWILAVILVGSFCTHTPVIVFSFGVKVNQAFWFHHAAVGEKILITYFLLQEFALQTIYTYTTARMLQDRSLAMSGGPLRLQSGKIRRNLLFFMIFAQFITLGADVSLATFTFLLHLLYKTILHPFFYGLKLKVEFVALNQLQSLVQPNPKMSPFSAAHGPQVQLHQHDNKELDVEAGGAQFMAHEKDPLCCAHCALSPTPNAPTSESLKGLEKSTSAGASSQPVKVQVSFTGTSTNQSFTEMERKYLGKYNK